jgi:hypothetical protein
MTALALELEHNHLSLFGDGGGEATLAEFVAGSWEDLAAARAVACPVCEDELSPSVVTTGCELIAARYAGCGTELD